MPSFYTLYLPHVSVCAAHKSAWLKISSSWKHPHPIPLPRWRMLSFFMVYLPHVFTFCVVCMIEITLFMEAPPPPPPHPAAWFICLTCPHSPGHHLNQCYLSWHVDLPGFSMKCLRGHSGKLPHKQCWHPPRFFINEYSASNVLLLTPWWKWFIHKRWLCSRYNFLIMEVIIEFMICIIYQRLACWTLHV